MWEAVHDPARDVAVAGVDGGVQHVEAERRADVGDGEVEGRRPLDLEQLVERRRQGGRVEARPGQQVETPLLGDEVVPLRDQAHAHVDVLEAQRGLAYLAHEPVHDVVVQGEREVVPLPVQVLERAQ